MHYKTDTERAIELVEDYGPLTRNQIKEYFRIIKEKDPEKTSYMLESLVNKNQLFASGEIIKASPVEGIDTKKIIAFWVYLAFVKETNEKTFAAKYPSQIGYVTDSVYVITVCEDPIRDNELIALREKKTDDVVPVIAGLNLTISEIRKDILPTKEFIYAEVKLSDILTSFPKITFTKVTTKEGES